MTIKRGALAVLTLVLAVSCTPQRERYRLVVPVPSTSRAPVGDHELLRLLALDDPLGHRAALRPAVAATDTAAPPFRIDTAADDSAQRALQCLTQAVYYEARSEPLDGQRAVAQVVLNRVRDRAFPDSVCKVVYQHPANRPGCQFSFVCDGSMDRRIEPGAWSAAGAVARAALAGSVYAPVGSATYYHTTAVSPWWAGSLQRIGLVGSHIFYRWGSALGRALSFRQSYSGQEVVARPVRTTAVSDGGVVVHTGHWAAGAVEAGVTVHRASLTVPAQRSAAASSFGVTLHYGERGASAQATISPEAAAEAAAS